MRREKVGEIQPPKYKTDGQNSQNGKCHFWHKNTLITSFSVSKKIVESGRRLAKAFHFLAELCYLFAFIGFKLWWVNKID